MTSADTRTWVGLFNSAAASGFTMADFTAIVAALKAPNRVAALRELLAAETRPAVRRGLEAGVAEAQQVETERERP